MKLRNKVREVREAQRLSQHEVARRTGLSRMTIRSVERDDGYEPNGTVMAKLCEALDDADLFWRERAEEPEQVPA